MKGDFSRNTFDPTKHYSGVLMQQGRVQVDADWNEQHAINQYRTQTEAGDVIGSCGVPESGGGFALAVNADSSDLTISPGRIYVDGILCELEEQTTYSTQPDYPNPSFITSSQGNPQVLSLEQGTYVALVYLDVWQRHITALDDLHIREVALGGPDTTTRAQTIWQVKLLPLAIPQSILDQYIPGDGSTLQQTITTLNNDLATLQQLEQSGGDLQQIDNYKQEIVTLGTSINNFLQHRMTCGNQYPEWDILTTPSTGTLSAQTQPVNNSSGPCLIPPSAGYQLLENQLYRVEIHLGTNDIGTNNIGGPTFKWSRDNGTVAVAIQQIDSSGNITVKDLGPDDILGFANVGGQLSWVEVVDDVSELNGRARPLVQVKSVDATTNIITVDADPSVLTAIAAIPQTWHPKLRRWDQVGPSATSNGVLVSGNWQDLEGGIQVQFSGDTYKTGDYWLIPARTATGAIEWPQNSSTNPPTAIAQLPLGIQHHYCRLGLLQQMPLDLTNWPTSKTLAIGQDCRLSFPSLTSPTAMHVVGTNWRNDDYFGTDRLFNEHLQVNLDAAPYANPPSYYWVDIASRVIVTLETPSFGFGLAAGPLAGAKETSATGESAESGGQTANGGESVAGKGVSASAGQIAPYTFNNVVNGYSYSDNYENVLWWTWPYINKPTLDQSLVDIMYYLGRPPYVRVTLKGHTIWSDQGGQPIYLDGQAFGQSEPGDLRADKATPRVALSFPSGAGARASDFESWFYLVPPPQQVTTVNFISIDANGQIIASSSAGPINLPPVPYYPHEVHFNSSEHINAIDITFSLPIDTTSISQSPLSIQVLSFGVQVSSQQQTRKEIPPPRPGEVRPPWAEALLPPHPAARRPDIVASGGGGIVTVQGRIDQPVQNPDGTVNVLRFVITDANFPNGFTPSFYYLAAAGGDTMFDNTTPAALTSLAVAGKSIAMPLDGSYSFTPGHNFYLSFNVPSQPQ